MSPPTAFAAPLAVGTKPALAAAPTSSLKPQPRLPAASPAAVRMVVEKTADKFMYLSQTREAKAAATPYGVYTVQCTEASGGANTAESKRVATLSADYRLRQASASARAADLFETRRAAIVSAHGSHKDETYAVRFPARAAASVLGRAERLRACSRYYATDAGSADELMFQCVDRQYKAAKVSGGVYGTACTDGASGGEAEGARVAALATQFRAGQLAEGVRAQMRFDTIGEAVALARGACGYEEAYFAAYPKMAGAMRYSTGAYASKVTETLLLTGVKGASIADVVQGENRDAVWPAFSIREATAGPKKAPWSAAALKNYAPMSAAAVEFGLAGAAQPFEQSKYEAWSSGWQPKSSVLPSSN